MAAAAAGTSASGYAHSALFIARNRFALLTKQGGHDIDIRNLRNATTKQIHLERPCKAMFYAGTGQILLILHPDPSLTGANGSGGSLVQLYDVQQQRALAQLLVPASGGVRYAYWSPDMSHLALVCKQSMVLTTKKLVQKCLITETTPIKSGAWDESGVFVYATLTHLKYALVQGDHGIIRTIDEPLYVCHVRGATVWALDRRHTATAVAIDPTEYRFKHALMRKDYELVLRMIKTSSLVGQSIIAYLRRKGYPEVRCVTCANVSGRSVSLTCRPVNV